MSIQEAMKKAIQDLNNAFDKYNMVNTPEAEQVLWHEIQSLKHKIDLIRKHADVTTSTIKRANSG